MKANVDLKSLGIGLRLGVCIMIGRGQSPAADTSGALAQRYQITARNTQDGAPEIYLLDQQRKVVEIFYLGGQDWKQTKPTFDIAKQVEQR